MWVDIQRRFEIAPLEELGIQELYVHSLPLQLSKVCTEGQQMDLPLTDDI